MPRLEGPAIDRITERESREAHAVRLRDRRAGFVSKLSLLPKDAEHATERGLIDASIQRIDEQQVELEKRGPVEMAANDQVTSQLKDEVASLREALTEATMKLTVVQAKEPHAGKPEAA